MTNPRFLLSRSGPWRCQRWTIGTALLGLVGLAGCESPARNGCTADSECKGQRTCQNGACADPISASNDAGASGADTTLPVTLPDASEAPPLAAVAKFCNDLRMQTRSFVLTVELGAGPEPIRMSAPSATCTPPAGESCTPIPTGDIPYVLLVEGEELARGFVRRVKPGDEMYLLGTLDEVTGTPIVAAGALKPEYKCIDLVFADE